MIKTNRHPALTSIAKEIPKGESIHFLIGMMWDLMYRNKGIGLAANQIGELKRVIVIHANGFKQELINPVITKRYGGKVMNKEGCLSYPLLQVKVSRYKQVIIEGFDRDWRPIKRKLKGLAAYCAQHEVDHLDGITIG